MRFAPEPPADAKFDRILQSLGTQGGSIDALEKRIRSLDDEVGSLDK